MSEIGGILAVSLIVVIAGVGVRQQIRFIRSGFGQIASCPPSCSASDEEPSGAERNHLLEERERSIAYAHP